jgi:hypothetical protein
MISAQYTFQGLLSSLEPRQVRKVAVLSYQVKLEQFLLGEMAFAGSEQFGTLAFCLEEKRKDLTVRQQGRLVDWVEAKMCYTDCLARGITGRGDPDEYQRLLQADAEKQRRDRLPGPDQGTLFTSLLFAVHHEEPAPGQKYYPGYRNRGAHGNGEIETAALAYVRNVITRSIQRDVVEYFMMPLASTSRLHVFALRRGSGAPA